MPGWDNLSRDELAHILGFLPIRQRLIVLRVSRATHTAGATTPALWKQLLLGKVDERFTDDNLSQLVRWAGASLTHVEVLNSPSLERGGADAGPQARPPRLGQHGGPSNPLTGLPAHRHVLGGPRDVR